MKFYAIESVRGLEMDKPVFTINSKNECGFGKLIKEERTIKGVERTFEMATFTNEGAPPAIAAMLVKDITHVAFPREVRKPKKDEQTDEGNGEIKDAEISHAVMGEQA